MKKTLSITLALLLVLVLLGFTVFAAPYNPSVEQKDGPELVDPLDGTLIITPYGLRNSSHTEYPDIKTMLEDAFGDITDAASLEALCTGVEARMNAMIAASTDPAAQGCTLANLLIEYLFDTSEASDPFIPYPKHTFTVATDLRPGQVFVILHKVGGEAWEVVTSYDLAANGNLTIYTDSNSPFAIAVDNLGRTNNGNGITSPKTEGEEQPRKFAWNSGSITGVVMVLFGAGLIVFGIVDRNKKRAQAQKTDPDSPLKK